MLDYDIGQFRHQSSMYTILVQNYLCGIRIVALNDGHGY